MKVVITGACGFIGRQLIAELETRGHQLRLLDMTRPEEATVFRGQTREHIPLQTDWPFVQAEITDEAAMVAACDGMDAEVHLAGEPRGLAEIAVAIFESNALGTFVAIDSAKRSGVGRYKRMKRVNSDGPTVFEALPGIEAVDVGRFQALRDSGHIVIDTRGIEAYGDGHIADVFGIGVGQHMSTWASWVVPYDTLILLVVSDEASAETAVRALICVGLDEVTGFLAGGIEAWTEAGYPLRRIPALDPGELNSRLSEGTPFRVLDVRNDDEWSEGHLPAALNIPDGELTNRVSEVAGEDEIACMCGSGYRSTVAASVLERAGRERVFNVRGGMAAWHAAGLPVELESAQTTPGIA